MRRRTLALAALLAIAACGGDAAGPPPAGAVRITVTWPGASPETVESALLTPLEQLAAGLPDVVRVDGQAAEGVAIVELAARTPAALDRLAEAARAALADAAPRLPTDAGAPMISKAQRTLPVLAIVPLPATDDPRRADARGRELARRTEVMNGVRAVDVCGRVDDQLQVRLDPLRLAAAGVTTTEFMTALRNDAVPAGRLDLPGSATTIRTTGAGLADLEALPLRPGVQLRDVATIARAAIAPCVAHTPAGRALVVTVEASALPAARAVATALRDGGAEVLPARTVVGQVALPDAATDVDAAIGELLEAGAAAVRVRREPPALEALVAAGADERALAAIDAVAARRGLGAVRWAGRGVVALEALVPADDLEAALTIAARGGAELTAAGHPARIEPRRTVTREVTIDRVRAADLGVSVLAVADALRLATGAWLGRFTDGSDALDVHATWPAGDDLHLDLTVASPRLGAVPLRELVTVTAHDGPAAILHRDRRRVVALWLRVPPGRRAALTHAVRAALPAATVADAW